MAPCKQQERNRLPVKGEIYREPSSTFLNGLRKSESRRPPNRHITGATTGVFFSAAPSSKSRGCASPAACRPDFRFGLPEIGAFSSLSLLVLGFGVRGGGGQKTLAFGPPALGPQKTQGVFWGATRPRNEKPGAVSRAGLGHTPEGYLFIHEFRFNVQKSQVEVTSCTEVTGCTTQRNGRPRRFAMSAPLPSAKNCRYRSHFRVVPIAERHLICGLLISCRTTVPALDFKRRKKCRTTLPD